MCNSVLRLQIVLCCFLLTWSLPRKSHDMQYGPGGPDGRGMRYREELPRDPWQNSMAELRQYSQPMPPLVPNDEVGIEPGTYANGQRRWNFGSIMDFRSPHVRGYI